MGNSIDIAILSDVHAHAFKYGSSRVPFDKAPGLYNSRLIDTMKALYEFTDYVETQGIKLVLFAGDLFHVRSAVMTVAQDLVFTWLQDLAKKTDQIIMIPGNHDMATRAGHHHSLRPFSSIDNVHVSERVEGVRTKMNLGVVTLPYYEGIETTKQALKKAGDLADVAGYPCVLLGHLGLQGGKVGSDYVLVSDSDPGVDDVPYKKFKHCFFGHFHEHQKVFPNGYYIGALTQHNWGDSGGKRGFLHVTVEDNGFAMSRHETSAPRFVKVSEDDDTYDVRPQDFVKYSSKTASTEGLTTSVRAALGNNRVEIVYTPEEADKVDLKLDRDKLSPEGLLDAWVEAYGEERLAELGKEILSEAREKTL
jgi:DNA repair exonuclease SbcCD nuclease subunit